MKLKIQTSKINAFLMLVLCILLSACSGGGTGGTGGTLDPNDVAYFGTDDDDRIYFGTHQISPGTWELQIYHEIKDTNGNWIVKDFRRISRSNPTFTIYGLKGNDRIEVVDNVTIGGHKFDAISVLPLIYNQMSFFGGQGNDTIIGSPGRDIIYGDDGNDTLEGRGGNDELYGNHGADVLDGGDGDDLLEGGNGNDHLIGGNGNDELHGGNNDDFLEGHSGDDTLYGEDGNDFLVGDQGNDKLYGGPGNDTLVGGTGDDELYGNEGNDTAYYRKALALTKYDDDNEPPDSDWNDTKPTDTVESTVIKNPYTEWAMMYFHRNGTTTMMDTTSNPQLLLSDRSNGAKILLSNGYPVYTIHKQYGISCGPSSLAMVMDFMGLADPQKSGLFFPRDLAEQTVTQAVASSRWPTTAVDVGYLLSAEHIIYEAYHKSRKIIPDWNPTGNGTGAFYTSGVLDNDVITPTKYDGSWYEIRYNIGNVIYTKATETITGNVQKWLGLGGQVGSDSDGSVKNKIPFSPNYSHLPYVANKFSREMPDARPLSSAIGTSGQNFKSLAHLKAVISGFIDNNIPLVVGVEDGDHFNTIIGYWNKTTLDKKNEFYVYLADPLDGWGRPFYKKPMRWRRLLLTSLVVEGDIGEEGYGPSRTLPGMISYGHSESGYYSGSWAKNIDATYGTDALCGRLPDCANIDLTSVRVDSSSGSYRIVDTNGILFNFDTYSSEATRALEIINHYRTNKVCFVGRPDSSFQYLLNHGNAPVGSITGETCAPINLTTIDVQLIGANWTLLDSANRFINFGDKESEARETLNIIQWYRFERLCWVGRNDGPFRYLRR